MAGGLEVQKRNEMKNYTHQNCKSRLKIKKRSDTISVCFLIDEPKIKNIHGAEVFQTVIIKNENLKS